MAAGLTRSAGYDAKRLAHGALEEKYGFTQDMDSYFLCTVEERNGQTVVTYRANEDVGDFAWKLGDYTVTIQDGQAEASWSNDGEAVGSDFSSDVWDTALLARDLEYFIYKDGYGPTIVTLADYMRRLVPGRFGIEPAGPETIGDSNRTVVITPQ